MNEQQEFDRFASSYETVLEQHTRISGEETGYFALYKVRTVHDVVGANSQAVGLRILDFGCGVGQSTPYFKEMFPEAELFGADISSASIDVARQNHGSIATYAAYQAGMPLPFGDNSFDIGFAACVFHHIPRDAQADVLQDIRRVLKPRGRLFVFEHNPFNPLTVKIVRDCPFDENAVLIKSRSMKDRMTEAGFEEVGIRYCLFVPGWLGWLRPIESALTWCPLGAQYYAMGLKDHASSP
jgi:SAM-dependent methyltransferase